jgi:hypothetical protein
MIICLNIIFVNTTSKSSFTITIEGPNKSKIEKDTAIANALLILNL